MGRVSYLAASALVCGASSWAGCAEKSADGTCPGERPIGATCLTRVVGAVVDDLNDPVPDLNVTVCGPKCFRGTTNEAGEFSVELRQFIVVEKYSVQAHGSPQASTFYHRIPAEIEDGEFDAGVLRVMSLPEDGPIMTTKLDLEGSVSPAQTARSSGVTLVVGEGTVVRLSVGDVLEGVEGARFRALELSDEQVEEFVPQLAGARVFALGPFETEFSGTDGMPPEVSLTVENRREWSPDSEVEVLALGTYLDPDWLAPSEFHTIGTALVASDGDTIELAADAEGAGLRHITWLALRP